MGCLSCRIFRKSWYGGGLKGLRDPSRITRWQVWASEREDGGSWWWESPCFLSLGASGKHPSPPAAAEDTRCGFNLHSQGLRLTQPVAGTSLWLNSPAARKNLLSVGAIRRPLSSSSSYRIRAQLPCKSHSNLGKRRNLEELLFLY